MPAETLGLLSFDCFETNPAGQICELLEADYRGVTTSTSLSRSAILSFYYETRQPSLVSARTRLLVAFLFSALINMQGCESVMGRTESLTLVDRIHPQSISLQALLPPSFPNSRSRASKAGNVAIPLPFISGVDNFVYRSERDRHLLCGRRCISCSGFKLYVKKQ